MTSALARVIARVRDQQHGWPDGEQEPHRPADRIRYHYEVERELADRLRLADRKDRTRLYAVLYDELFERVADHPQLVWKENPDYRAAQVERRLRGLRPFLHRAAVYLEIGVGDAALASAVAPSVARAYGIDVSKEILDTRVVAPNVELVVSDGVSLPVADASVTVALSDQVIEHLHPDDLRQHLTNVRRVLAPGGHYVILTPNRLSGPHDISRAFDQVPTGLHMREYTNAELQALLLDAGFSIVRHGFVSSQSIRLTYPLRLVSLLELVLEHLGASGRRLARIRPVETALGCRLIARR